jgi:hypothetical protein
VDGPSAKKKRRKAIRKRAKARKLAAENARLRAENAELKARIEKLELLGAPARSAATSPGRKWAVTEGGRRVPPSLQAGDGRGAMASAIS